MIAGIRPGLGGARNSPVTTTPRIRTLVAAADPGPEAIWWSLEAPTVQGVRLYQLADLRRALDPRFADPGRYPTGGLP